MGQAHSWALVPFAVNDPAAVAKWIYEGALAGISEDFDALPGIFPPSYSRDLEAVPHTDVEGFVNNKRCLDGARSLQHHLGLSRLRLLEGGHTSQAKPRSSDGLSWTPNSPR